MASSDAYPSACRCRVSQDAQEKAQGIHGTSLELPTVLAKCLSGNLLVAAAAMRVSIPASEVAEMSLSHGYSLRDPLATL